MDLRLQLVPGYRQFSSSSPPAAGLKAATLLGCSCILLETAHGSSLMLRQQAQPATPLMAMQQQLQQPVRSSTAVLVLGRLLQQQRACRRSKACRPQASLRPALG